MKKNMLFVCLILSFSVSQAQLLWKVSGNGLKHPSYLFGTHHLIPIQFLDSVPGLYRAFNASNMVVGEMITSNVDATAKIQRAAMMPDHIKMRDLLSENEYELVDKELKSSLKIGLKELSIMNPTLINTLYEIEIYKKLTGFTEDVQIDSYFQLVAAEQGKKVIGLETVEQQITILFGNASLQRQAEVLVETIKQKDSALVEIVNMNKLYKAGKIDELVQLAKGKNKKSDMTLEEYAKLVDNRNTDWLTKLPPLFKDSSCFVAVGALHFGGANGLLKLLQGKGYKVTAVTE